MKKSNMITLVLITAALASCHKPHHQQRKRVYMRSDQSAVYSSANYGGYDDPMYHHNNAIMWYYAFRPYGYYNGVSYSRAGYYSGGISANANIGSNSTKSGIVRGGFSGGKGFSVSS